MTYVIVHTVAEINDLLSNGYHIAKSYNLNFHFIMHGSGYYEAYFSNKDLLIEYIKIKCSEYRLAKDWFYFRPFERPSMTGLCTELTLTEIADLYIEIPDIPDIPEVPIVFDSKIIIFAIIAAIIFFAVVMLL